jgi:tRNA(Met) cytidine acetyltransferase
MGPSRRPAAPGTADCLSARREAPIKPDAMGTTAALARRLSAQARSANHRLALVLSGTADWTAAAAQSAVAALTDTPADSGTLWLTERDLWDGSRPPGALPLAAGTRLIGGECGLLIYDAWSGFDPDGFGAAAGTLRGGGLLLLLAPPLDAWPGLADPQAERIAVWPYRAETVGGRFIGRLAQVLRPRPGCVVLREGEAAPELDQPLEPPERTPAPHPDPRLPATPDQAQAIDALLRLARGRARRPLVLNAHRGRGKSAALGIAAARLMVEGLGRILVTAPRRDACEALFRHAALAWPGARPGEGGLDDEGRTIVFLPPDAVLETHPTADLLLVDEAAGIPAPLLAGLLERYPRVAFATTVHGYEGTGRGFDVRFRATLERRTPGWQALTLETPIRWSADDPLEPLVFRALLLDASPASASDLADASPKTCRFERLDRDRLATDESMLSQVFGLLVLAHYQTRPLDLRMLLDGPNVRVYALRRGDLVAATLIAAKEGGMEDPELRQAIFAGDRRPRGHLLPQTLSAHGGLRDAPALRYLRVVRIAVHPALARRGLGRSMLRQLFREARRDGIDALGTSFGATPELIAFWSACGYRPAQIGTGRNAASGEHALVMLRRTSPRGWTFAHQAERRMERRLPILLPGPLRRLDPRVAAALAATIRAEPPAPEWDEEPAARAERQSFASGHRTLDAALPALADLARRCLGPALRARALTLDDAALLTASVRQLRPIRELVEPFGAAGRDDLTRRLRALAGRLMAVLPEP